MDRHLAGVGTAIMTPKSARSGADVTENVLTLRNAFIGSSAIAVVVEVNTIEAGAEEMSTTQGNATRDAAMGDAGTV
eukprot:IDg15263t1